MNGLAAAQLLPVGILAVILCLWVIIRANSRTGVGVREAVLGRIMVVSLVLGPTVQSTFPDQPLWVGSMLALGVTALGVVEASLMPSTRPSRLVSGLWISLVVWWVYVSVATWLGGADLSISILGTPIWVGILYRTSPGKSFVHHGVFPALAFVMWATLLFAPSGRWLLQHPDGYQRVSSEPFEGTYFTWLSDLIGVPGRYGGFFLDPNMLGLLCVLATAVALSVGGRKAIVLLAPTAVLLLMSSSRASMAATCAVVAIAVIAQGRHGKFRVVGLATLVVVGGVLITSLLIGLGADTSGTLTATGRLEVWHLALADFEKAPWFGQWYEQGAVAVLGDSWAEGHMHNSLIQVAWQFGVVGLVIWGSWAYYLLRTGWARPSRHLLVGYIVAAMFGSYAATPFGGVPLLIIVTVAVLADKRHTDRQRVACDHLLSRRPVVAV